MRADAVELRGLIGKQRCIRVQTVEKQILNPLHARTEAAGRRGARALIAKRVPVLYGEAEIDCIGRIQRRYRDGFNSAGGAERRADTGNGLCGNRRLARLAER